jgi:cytochrome c1
MLVKLSDENYIRPITMKQNKNELDVDFIGGNGPLTEQESKAISAYIKAQKKKTEAKQIKKASRKTEKVVA